MGKLSTLILIGSTLLVSSCKEFSYYVAYEAEEVTEETIIAPEFEEKPLESGEPQRVSQPVVKPEPSSTQLTKSTPKLPASTFTELKAPATVPSPIAMPPKTMERISALPKIPILPEPRITEPSVREAAKASPVALPKIELPAPTKEPMVAPKPVAPPIVISAPAPDITQSFAQEALQQKFDFIFVVDNSLSMRDIKEFVKQNLKKIIEPLAKQRKQLDFRAAVTIIDPTAVFSGRGISYDVTGKSARFLRSRTGRPYVEGRSNMSAPQWENLQKEWYSILDKVVETQFAYWEQGLKAATSALSFDRAEKILRPDSHVVFVWLSDENDYSSKDGFNYKVSKTDVEESTAPEHHPFIKPGQDYPWLPKYKKGTANTKWTALPVATEDSSEFSYINFFHTLEVNTESKRDVLLYPIVHNDPIRGPICDGSPSNMPPSVGYRYLELVDRWNAEHPGKARALSICREQLEQSFATIAELTSDREVCHTVTVPMESIKAVSVNGEAVPESLEYGYVVKKEGERMRVCFLGHGSPSPGQRIEIVGRPRANP